MATSFSLPEGVNYRTFSLSNRFVVPQPGFWIDGFTDAAEDPNRDFRFRFKKLNFSHANKAKVTYFNVDKSWRKTGSFPNFISARMAVGAVYNCVTLYLSTTCQYRSLSG